MTRPNVIVVVTTIGAFRPRAELVRIFDGNSSLRKHSYRTVAVPKGAPAQVLLEAALRTFHISDDPKNYYISETTSKETAGKGRRGVGGQRGVRRRSGVGWRAGVRRRAKVGGGSDGGNGQEESAGGQRSWGHTKGKGQ